jgi:putative methylase
MSKITSKSSLAVSISGLKGFEKPKVRAEQYITEPEIAAEMLWLMHMRGELDGKTIADLGSGTGILSLGALLLGAKKAFLVEKDEDAMEIAKQNHNDLIKQGFKLGEAVFVLSGINDFSEKVDVVVENPPFGTKEKHADKEFLEKAFSLADAVYSFHKTSTESFVSAIAKDNGFEVSEKIGFSFPLKAVHEFHRRQIHRIEVTLFRLERKKQKDF